MNPPHTSQQFDIKTAYATVKTDNLKDHINVKGIEFYDLLLNSYGQDSLLALLKKFRPLINEKINFETKHLSSEENVIFSSLEEAYYPQKFRSLFKFLDFKVWGLVGLGFLFESSFHIFDMISGGLP